jgi:prepilin-type N-terminal cleavage/methylation domain-containing protein
MDQRGITLLEVTIALFVLTIGLLGLAGLHLVAMQSD